MAEFLDKIGLTFDDVTLVPNYSTIKSRTQSTINYNTKLGAMTLGIPIISANMDCVTNADMADAMAMHGALGILHRFFPNVETRMAESKRCEFISVGTSAAELKFIDEVMTAERKPEEFSLRGLCVDVAHGHSESVANFIEQIQREWPHLTIIAGNVCTYDGAAFLVDLGVAAIKVGIGPSPVCTTRYVTGHGVPQITAITDARLAVGTSSTHIIADGGIRSSGDIVKALAAGANSVMLGSILAATDESAAQKIMKNNRTVAMYRGQSSHEIQKDMNKFREEIAAEGIEIALPNVRPLKTVLQELCGGIRSGFSYAGVYTIADLQKHAKFIRVTENGHKEGMPNHGRN